MRQDPLLDALRELTAEQASERPSPAVEASLRSALRRRRSLRRTRLVGGALAAAAVAAVAAAVVWSGPGLGRPTEPAESAVAAPPAPMLRVTEFVPLDYGRPDPGVVTAGRLTRVTLPATAPSELGFPISPYAFPEGIEADVLLSEDGTPQAVRFVVPYR